MAENLHQEFRLATIDHQISGAPREPIRISKLKIAIVDMENKQDSQKLLVSSYFGLSKDVRILSIFSVYLYS